MTSPTPETLNYTIEKLKTEFSDAVKRAYIDGFNDGSAYDKPTQKQFDETHKDPVGYGEDGEIYVLAGGITASVALRRIKRFFDRELFDCDDVEDLANHLHYTKVAYTPEEVSSEPGYYYRGDGSGAYDAWVWTT